MNAPSVILRLEGPFQTYVKHQFDETAPQPTPEAVAGMIASASGVPKMNAADRTGRDAILRTIVGFSVVTVRPGQRFADFQTIGGHTVPSELLSRYNSNRYGVWTADRTGKRPLPVLRDVSYLVNAAFDVVVQFNTLESAQAAVAALLNPVFPVYLGRRTALPSVPLVLPNVDIFDKPAEELAAYIKQTYKQQEGETYAY